MNRIIPFRPDHLDLLILRENERVSLGGPEGLKESAHHILDQGMAGTIFVDGRVICVLGYHPLWDGVYQVWIIPSVYLETYRFPNVKIVRGMLASVAKTHGVRRFQTSCLADDLHNRWMTFLGFQEEGRMIEYTCDGKDHVMWSKLIGR